jgi:hypothetical protein
MLIKNARLNYVHVEEPHQFPAQNGKQKDPVYGVTIFLPKNDPQIPAIKAEIMAAVKAKWADKPPAGLWNPLRDGDTDQFTTEHYAGSVFMNCRNSRPVAVVDAQVRPLPKGSAGEGREWDSGDYGNVYVDFYGFDNVQRGIGASLQGVQFTRHGERIVGGGRKAVDEMFKPEADVGADSGDAIFA